MCEYCENFYTGDSFIPINSQTVEVGIFGKVFIEAYISKTEAGNSTLTVGICPSNGMVIEQQKIIRFCPMCGKEFTKGE